MRGNHPQVVFKSSLSLREKLSSMHHILSVWIINGQGWQSKPLVIRVRTETIMELFEIIESSFNNVNFIVLVKIK